MNDRHFWNRVLVLLEIQTFILKCLMLFVELIQSIKYENIGKIIVTCFKILMKSTGEPF